MMQKAPTINKQTNKYDLKVKLEHNKAHKVERKATGRTHLKFKISTKDI